MAEKLRNDMAGCLSHRGDCRAMGTTSRRSNHRLIAECHIARSHQLGRGNISVPDFFSPGFFLLKERTSDYVVIPAQAGIQGLKKHRPTGRFWMPAFAGMTEFLLEWP
jgi:hypothetical protein